MPKIATGAKQLLSDTFITVSWSGIGTNDELKIHLDEESISLSSLQLDKKLLDFMRQPNPERPEYQIGLDRIPKAVKEVNFVLNTSAHGPFAWSVIGHNTDEAYQSDAITVGMNLSCYLLRLTRSGDKWELENINIPVLASGTIGVPLYLVSEEIRPLAQYAAFRNIARDRKNFFALIDLTASMSPWLAENAHLICMQAISAVSATVTRKFLPVSLNGLKSVEIEAGSAGQQELQAQIRNLTSQNLVSSPLHSLIPKLVKDLGEKSELFVISDEVPFISPEVIEILEAKDIDLNLLLLGDDAIIPKLASSSKIRVSAAGDVTEETPVEKILDVLS